MDRGELHGLDLQARRGYYAPKHLARSRGGRQARNPGGAVFARRNAGYSGRNCTCNIFKSSDVAARIAVLARVNVKNLRFRKAEGRNNDNLTIISGVFDRNGNYVTGMQKTVVS